MDISVENALRIKLATFMTSLLTYNKRALNRLSEFNDPADVVNKTCVDPGGREACWC